MLASVALSALLSGALGAYLVSRTVVRPESRAQVRPAEPAAPKDPAPPTATALPPLPVPEPATTADPPKPPVVEPGPAPADTADTRKTAPRGAHSPGTVAPVVPASARTPTHPPETAPATTGAAPTTSGVAPGLKLKVD
jgi:hypothetical protein